MLIAANEKYAKRGQALITKGDPQRLEEVAAANRNKADAGHVPGSKSFGPMQISKKLGNRWAELFDPNYT